MAHHFSCRGCLYTPEYLAKAPAAANAVARPQPNPQLLSVHKKKQQMMLPLPDEREHTRSTQIKEELPGIHIKCAKVFHRSSFWSEA
ncbi:hypothetical protein pdam_00002230 [Pocillopora damicornis]|uniref:Uncharacterized protein n=1 Tax=Pocillopora damicornis TaxID=46731 RepID=A0A3M6TFG1_POCDA|nr:hypothetical protein pdam_00002230 [Pocillopora damicornis]